MQIPMNSLNDSSLRVQQHHARNRE